MLLKSDIDVQQTNLCIIATLDDECCLRVVLGTCSIDFFNLCHCQVWNYKILNQSKQDQNFAVNLWKRQKQKWKVMKYIKIEWNQSIVPFYTNKFCYILWNFIMVLKIFVIFHLIL